MTFLHHTWSISEYIYCTCTRNAFKQNWRMPCQWKRFMLRCCCHTYPQPSCSCPCVLRFVYLEWKKFSNNISHFYLTPLKIHVIAIKYCTNKVRKRGLIKKRKTAISGKVKILRCFVSFFFTEYHNIVNSSSHSIHLANIYLKCYRPNNRLSILSWIYVLQLLNTFPHGTTNHSCFRIPFESEEQLFSAFGWWIYEQRCALNFF